jgi:site-specific recombinase XerC
MTREMNNTYLKVRERAAIQYDHMLSIERDLAKKEQTVDKKERRNLQKMIDKYEDLQDEIHSMQSVARKQLRKQANKLVYSGLSENVIDEKISCLLKSYFSTTHPVDNYNSQKKPIFAIIPNIVKILEPIDMFCSYEIQLSKGI